MESIGVDGFENSNDGFSIFLKVKGNTIHFDENEPEFVYVDDVILEFPENVLEIKEID